MAVPQCTITGEAAALFGDLNGDGLLTDAEYDGLKVLFVPNVSATELLPIDGVMRTLEPVEGFVDAGVLKRVDDEGALVAGVKLLANGPEVAFNLEWTITFPAPTFRLNGFRKSFSDWSFVAPEMGETKDLSELPRLFKASTAGVELVESAVLGAMVDSKLDAEIPPKLESTVPPAVTADLEGRDMAITDAGGGAAQFTLGGVDLGPAFPLPAATWSGVTGREAGVRQLTGGIVPIEKFAPSVIGNAAAFEAALAESDATGGTVTFENAKTYSFDAGVTVTDKDVRVNWNGACIVRSSSMANAPVLTAIFSHSTPQAVTSIDNNANFTPTSSTLKVLSRVAKIAVADTTGWSVGDYAVVVADDQIVGANPERAAQFEGDRVRIAKVEAGFLYASRPLRATLTTNIRVARMTQRDFVLDSPWVEDAPGSPITRTTAAILVRGAVSPRVVDWQPRNLMSIGMRFEGSVKGKIDGLDAYNLRTSSADSAFGYGVTLVSCCDFVLHDLNGDFLRHACTTGAGQNMTPNSPDLYRYGSSFGHRYIGGAAGEGGHAAYDLHEEAAYCTIDSCSVEWNHPEPDGTAAALQLRGRYSTLQNSWSRGPGGLKMYAYDGGGFFRVKNYSHELIPGIYGASAIGITFDNSATLTTGRASAELIDVSLLARNLGTNLVQLNKASVRATGMRIETNIPATYKPFVLTDSDFYAETLYIDIRGSGSTTRLFELLDAASSVRVDRLIVVAGGASWGPANFSGFNGTVEIGRIETDTLPVSALHANIGSGATWSVGDVLLNQRSRVNGTDTRSNADVTLNSLSAGRQVLSAALTANRTVTEPTIALYPGQVRRFARTSTSTGAFSWIIGGESLATSAWVDRMWNGTAWVTIGKGAL